MLIKFTKNTKGAPEGHTLVHYSTGSVCDVPSDLAEVFLSLGVAEKYSPTKKVELRRESKDLGGAPENKSRKVK